MIDVELLAVPGQPGEDEDGGAPGRRRVGLAGNIVHPVQGDPTAVRRPQRLTVYRAVITLFNPPHKTHSNSLEDDLTGEPQN